MHIRILSLLGFLVIYTNTYVMEKQLEKVDSTISENRESTKPSYFYVPPAEESETSHILQIPFFAGNNVSKLKFFYAGLLLGFIPYIGPLGLAALFYNEYRQERWQKKMLAAIHGLILTQAIILFPLWNRQSVTQFITYRNSAILLITLAALYGAKQYIFSNAARKIEASK